MPITKPVKPQKLTPMVHKIIVDSINLGTSKEMSAQAAGITRQQLYTWLKSAELPGACDELIELKADLDRVEGERMSRWLAVIENAAINEKDWKAAAWKLERIYPHLFGRMHVTTEDTRRVVVMPAKLNFDEWSEQYGPEALAAEEAKANSN